MSVTVTLQNLTMVAPALTGGAVSVDLEVFPMVVDADPKAVAIEVVLPEEGQTTTLTTYSLVGGKRRFYGSVPLPADLGTYTLTMKAKNALDSSVSEISSNLTFQVIKASNVDVPQALPPSGIRVFRLANFVKVEWQVPNEPGFLGVRVLVSPDSSGVETPFVQWGELVSSPSRTALDTLSTSTHHSQNGLHFITTTDAERVQVAYSVVTFPKSQVTADEFFVALSTVIQDPDTHHVHESYTAGPFRCSFVDLRTVSPEDFPAGLTPEDIAVQLIRRLGQDRPELDLSPRSELRDTLIDPVALELANASTREWFSRVSQSVDAMIGIDDTDADGVSDDPSLNDYKQALARAFRISNDKVQELIDTRFDVLGASCGLTRGGAQPSMVDVLFYTMLRPTQRVVVSEGAMVNTMPDEETPSVTFKTLGSASIDPTTADSFYIPERGVYGVTIPCLCTMEGTIGNVGAGTVRTVVSGINQTMLCTNPLAADFGLDYESNHDFASRIKNRQVVGVDTGRVLGYEEEARKAYGVVDVKVVPSGRLEMLRDWDPVRQKHIFGTVDVYARGRSFSQNPEIVPYRHTTTGIEGAYSTYTRLRLLDASTLRFGFDGAPPTYPTCALVELYAERQGLDSANTSLSFFLGVDKACFDATTNTFFLDPEAISYRIQNGEVVLGGKNSSVATTLQSGTTLWARVRSWSPLTLTPAKQPVSQVYSIAGASDQTGVIPANQIRLIKTEDPLLEGGSSRSHDKVVVDNATAVITKLMTFEVDGPDVLDLGEGVAVGLDSQGLAQGITSVLSLDNATLYSVNQDYTLVCLGQYGRFGIKRTPGSRIPLDVEIKVSFPVYRFLERVTLVTENVTLTGSTYAQLTKRGVVTNSWAPATHGKSELVNDAALIAAKIPRERRYIKVVNTNVAPGASQIMVEGKDFALDIDEATGTVRIARFYSDSAFVSAIHDNDTVSVSYYAVEVFDVITRYPQFIGQIAERLESTRHAAADVLVKVMQENTVDLDFEVTLKSNATPEIVDRRIRTMIVAAFDNAKGLLSQAEIVRRVKAVPGVANVTVPFRRMAKSDGSYDVGLIIPTNTKWDTISTLGNQDPTFANKSWAARTWVTRNPVLRYKTIPSGGKADSYVGLLYEGEAYKRVMSLNDLRLATDASFYIIGINDRFDQFTPVSSAHWGKIILVTPAPTATRQEISDPGLLAYRVTYQVFGEAGAQDIPMSPTEYLRPGRITIDYVLDEVAR